MLVPQVDEGEDDANGKYPFRDVKWDGRLNFGRPFIESQQLNGSKGIDSVDGDRDGERYIEIAIGNVGKYVAGFEIIELLASRRSVHSAGKILAWEHSQCSPIWLRRAPQHWPSYD